MPLAFQPRRDGPKGHPRRISELLEQIVGTARCVLRHKVPSLHRAAIDALMADLRASIHRAADLRMVLDSAAMLLVALTHFAETYPNDDGRWGLIAEQLVHFIEVDVRRAGELELEQMRDCR